MMTFLQCLWLFGICIGSSTAAFGFGGGNDKVKLSDINVLSLYSNKMTTGRRSSPVPQLKCVGGSAGCSAFQPQVVQCYNRGSDGYDIQWECKTDMDNEYRLGQIEVSCEGYAYPDDEYILKGSCGLEYTLDLTKEGTQKNQYQRQHSYYGDDQGSNYSYKRKSSGIGDWITLAIIGVIIYGIYRSCIATSSHNPDDPDDSHPRRAGYGFGAGGNPPPPGFRPGYGSDSCSGSGAGGFGTGGRGAGGGGGFWSGAATGGMLGYLFGSRGNQGYGYGARGYGNRGYGNSGFFGGGGGGFGGGGFGGGGGRSSGTRTASGFGGTRRR